MERKFKTGDKVICINLNGLTSPLRLSAGKEYTLEYACDSFVTIKGVKGDYFLSRFELVGKSFQQIYDEACAIASTINDSAVRANKAVVDARFNLDRDNVQEMLCKQGTVVDKLEKDLELLKASLEHELEIFRTLLSKRTLLAERQTSHM
jgi:hypothetical protein